MTDFNHQEYRETLAAIASGAVVECMEPYRETFCGIFRTLHNAGYIDGIQVASLNRFVLIDMALTPKGHMALTAFNSAPLS